MTLCTQSGSLLHHYEVIVDSRFVSRQPKSPKGLQHPKVPAVWFGLSSVPGHVWGCHVLLDNGAVYRSLPPNALQWGPDATENWSPNDAQRWNCYGSQFSLVEYTFLRGMDCEYQTRAGDLLAAQYLFTAIPVGDGWSRIPQQAKEFFFLQTQGGRLTIQPSNTIHWKDRSFVSKDPSCKLSDLAVQEHWESCDD